MPPNGLNARLFSPKISHPSAEKSPERPLVTSPERPLVFIVDDDDSVRQAVARLIRSLGFEPEIYASARELLRRPPPDRPACLVLDVRMPGLSGLDLQKELAERQLAMPIIFVTGHGTIPMSVQAMKAGAVDFLTKPFNDEDLLEAIGHAIDKCLRSRRERAELAAIKERLDTLTPREREVFEMVVTGRLNKQISGALGVSEKTVKVHRARVMQKMEAGSLAELVRMAERLGPVGL